MGYYRGGDCMYGRGDYYRGDYYRGDPGIFSGIGKALKFVAGAAKGFVTGGPVGAVAGAIRTVIPTRPAGTALAPIQPPPISIQPPPFGPPGEMIQAPVGTMLRNGFFPGCQLRGTRPNKSGYYKQQVKGVPESAVYIPKGSVCVKSRRMNIANPRALRRAVRRAQGFAKMARRVLTFVSARAPKGRAKFKRKR
jgi:hypothetical protein